MIKLQIPRSPLHDHRLQPRSSAFNQRSLLRDPADLSSPTPRLQKPQRMPISHPDPDAFTSKARRLRRPRDFSWARHAVPQEGIWPTAPNDGHISPPLFTLSLSTSPGESGLEWLESSRDPRCPCLEAIFQFKFQLREYKKNTNDEWRSQGLYRGGLKLRVENNLDPLFPSGFCF